VSYPSSFSKLQDNIIVGIRDTIIKQKNKFSNEGSYSKGGTAAGRDVHRLLVAFTKEADQKAFQALRHVVFEDDKGGLLHAQIGQERISYEEILNSDGAKGAEKVFIVLKKMPDSWTQNQIEAAFTFFVWKARGFEHPFLAEFSKTTWFWHKSGIQRRMLIAEVIPHEEDPRCEKVPSIHNPRPENTVPFIIGCNLHKCKLCGQMGHRAEVHDSFKGRPGLKRKGPAQAENQAEGSGKMREFILLSALRMQWPYLSVPALYNSGCPVMLISCSLCTSVAAYFAPVYLHTKISVQLQRLQIAALTGYSDRFLLFQSPCCYACTTAFCHVFGFRRHVFKVHF
jgi:hypothetical protein